MSLDNHKGKAHAALRRMLWRGIILLFALLIGGAIAQLTTIIFSIAWGFVFFLWILFTLFTLWFTPVLNGWAPAAEEYLFF